MLRWPQHAFLRSCVGKVDLRPHLAALKNTLCACLNFLHMPFRREPLLTPTPTHHAPIRKLQVPPNWPCPFGTVAVISPTCGLSGWRWWQKAATLLQVKRRLTRLGQPAADIQSTGMEIAACTSFLSLVCTLGTDVIVFTPRQTLFGALRAATHSILRSKSTKQRASLHFTHEAGTG